MDRAARSTIPADPREWQPQRVRPTRGTPFIADPIAEPLWSGARVLVQYRDAEQVNEWGTVEMLYAKEGAGFDLARRALDQLRRSVIARHAIIDGIITEQTLESGVNMEFDVAAGDIGGDLAFVALDLLSLDRQLLLDVPLLERKRLLESVLHQSLLVRLSPWVRLPLNPWLRTWTAAGFKGALVKDSNSRYVPGSTTIEWTAVTGPSKW